MEFNKLMSDVRNPQSGSFKIMVGIVILILILIIWRYRKNKARWDKLNPVFLEKGQMLKNIKK